MAAALLLTRPKLVASAILFRPLSAFVHGLSKSLDGIPALDHRR
jgi:hypothetical protein